MSFEFNDDAFDGFAKRMEDAINECCEIVATAHAGESYDDVRAALMTELGKRFETGTGPDQVVIDQLAGAIVARAGS